MKKDNHIQKGGVQRRHAAFLQEDAPGEACLQGWGREEGEAGDELPVQSPGRGEGGLRVGLICNGSALAESAG